MDIAIARRIVANKQYKEVDGVLLDLTTANLMVQVYDALSKKAQDKFDTLSVERAASICWKLVK